MHDGKIDVKIGGSRTSDKAGEGGHLDPEIRGEGGGGLKKNVVTAVITDTVHLAISSDVVIHFTHPIL